MELKEFNWFCKHEKRQKQQTLCFDDFLYWIQYKTSFSMWVSLKFSKVKSSFIMIIFQK